MWIDHGPNEGDEETLVRERRKRETNALKTDRPVERERGQIGSDSFPFLPPPLSHRLKTKI